MYKRRRLLKVMATAPLFGVATEMSWLTAKAEEDKNVEAEIKQWIERPENSVYFDPVNVPDDQRGSKILAPDDARVKKAAAILAAVPTGLSPIETARWMMNKIPADFTMEWPPDTPQNKLPANPLIVAFFAATKTKPFKGDETAWCAAFACWVLKHCGKPYTNNAGSSSFRDFAALPKVDAPAIGDLVVFRRQSDPIFGHVAFFDGFVDTAKTRVWCLGGNQGNKISRKPFSVVGGDLRLHSYRRIA